MSQPKITLYWFAISHPAQAAKRMLDYKGLEYERVSIPVGTQPIVLRALGFPGITVPALKVGDEKVQGTTAISRKLEDVKPEPPLFGETDEDFDEITDAETWAERELQDVPRRVFRWLGSHRQSVRAGAVRAQGVPAPLAGILGWPLIVPTVALARLGGANEENIRHHLADLPANLDRVDELLAEGVIGGKTPNAADFQIATTIHTMLPFADLEPFVRGRPCEAYAIEFIGREPKLKIPAGLPAEWLPAQASQ